MSPRKKERLGFLKKDLKNNPRIRLAKEKNKNKLIVVGFIITATLILGLIGYAILYATVLKDRKLITAIMKPASDWNVLII